ncbi:MAG: TIGR04222 domain-containing membrane protein [Planctomycetota bacterium]
MSESSSRQTTPSVTSPPSLIHGNDWQHELWRRLSSWHPDNVDDALPFSVRLQREHGWTVSYTAKVIDEYRRFLFLSQVAGHVVCPSEDVDQVWHQHLTYTRSYWDDLCAQVLRKKLHHQPTKGGPSEHQLYMDLYSKTLASYELWFVEQPDERVWPCQRERFFSKDMQRVDRRKYFVIPRPDLALPAEILAAISDRLRETQLWHRGRKIMGFGLGVLLAPAAIPLGPLDWAGPDFLKWYAVILSGAIVAAFALRHILWPNEPELQDNLDYCEVACLTGKWKLAVNAVLAKSVASKHVTTVVHGTTIQFLLDGTERLAESDFEGRVIQSLDQSAGRTLSEVHHDMREFGENLEESLRERGFLTGNAFYGLAARLFSSLLMAIVALIGFVKVGMGIVRGRPVGFLVLMLIVPCVLAVWFLLRPRLTASARRWLRRQQSDLAELKQDRGEESRSPEQIALGTALFGVAALASTQLMPLKTAWQGDRGTPGSSGCATVGCGGAGGGCGGDGGGGCGGCGGGGD